MGSDYIIYTCGRHEIVFELKIGNETCESEVQI